MSGSAPSETSEGGEVFEADLQLKLDMKSEAKSKSDSETKSKQNPEAKSNSDPERKRYSESEAEDTANSVTPLLSPNEETV